LELRHLHANERRNQLVLQEVHTHANTGKNTNAGHDKRGNILLLSKNIFRN
jgi:hypothetical protein